MNFFVGGVTMDVNSIKGQSWIGNGFISHESEDSALQDFFDNHFAVQAKPFVKWVGGKRQLLKQFRDLYPQDFDPVKNQYFEPFVGGGAVFFDLQPCNATLSDWNEELVTTYKTIRDDVEALIEDLKKQKYEKEFFLKVRAKNPKKLSPLKVASRFIYLNRTCFNGMYRVNKSGGFNVPFGRYTNPKICDEVNLRNVSRLLQNVEIEHRSYVEVLEHAQAGDFIYFDPPYYPVSKTSSFTSYNADAFLEKEQKELCDVFKQLHDRGCKVMLSNSDTPFIREIYGKLGSGINIKTVQAGRNINSNSSGRGKVLEVVVVNY
jgi:DNA adenine methylase